MPPLPLPPLPSLESPPKRSLLFSQAAIIRAEGEAEAAARISKAMADYGTALIDLRRIDVSHLGHHVKQICRRPCEDSS